MEELDLGAVVPTIKKILLIGAEGSGKTHFIGTMPKPIYIFSFDGGYRTLAGMAGITVGVCMDEDRYKPHAYADFKQKFDMFKKGLVKYKWPDGREEPYKTLAFDSFTTLSKYIFDNEQKVNNTIDKPAGYGPYMNTKSRLQDTVIQANYMSEYVVCTAQIESEKDEITGEIFFKPSTEGKFRDEAGQWFDAVLFLVVDKNTDGTKVYKALTVGDRRQKAKIRLPSSLASKIDAVEKPDFQVLLTKINGGK